MNRTTKNPQWHVKPASWFSQFATYASHLAGHSVAFLAALVIVALWGATGPFYHFSDTWQLVINTGTTIVTFLMVFLIQNSQNRDTMAIHVKLDELIRAIEGAQNSLLDLENLDEQQAEVLRKRYLALARVARRHAQSRRSSPRFRWNKSRPDASARRSATRKRSAQPNDAD